MTIVVWKFYATAFKSYLGKRCGNNETSKDQNIDEQQEESEVLNQQLKLNEERDSKISRYMDSQKRSNMSMSIEEVKKMRRQCQLDLITEWIRRMREVH